MSPLTLQELHKELKDKCIEAKPPELNDHSATCYELGYWAGIGVLSKYINKSEIGVLAIAEVLMIMASEQENNKRN